MLTGFNEVLAALTLLALALLIYHHLGYPILLRLTARPDPPLPPEIPDALLPPVTILVPAFNEAAVIADKIDNLVSLDYPRALLRIIVISDGSVDQTAALARQAAARHPLTQIEILENPLNQGKTAVLNAALCQITMGIICLTDASALISSDALRRAARHFSDPGIGVVAATYRFQTPGTEGESAYWRYQTEIKRRESQWGGVIGVHGACYLFRAELFEPLAPDTINDDFILPMQICARGHRAVYDTGIVATELETVALADDQRRRRRISAGNMQQLLRLPHLLHPRHGRLALAFFSGKMLRTLSPFLMVLALCGTFWLALLGWAWAIAMFGLQITAYLLAILPALAPERRWIKPIRLLHYLVAGHGMALIGGTRYLFGMERGRWHRITPQTEPEFLPLATHISPATQIGKRVFDIIGAVLGLCLGSLVIIPVALAIKLTSPGPIIFRQMRIGRARADRTDLFVMLKFRTMYVDAEARSGPVWASKNDPRITPVGRFLRKTRLDEIPQLLNVLAGDMSLVGPRPERPGISNRLEDAIPFFSERTFGIRPGITGLAQVNQGYDETLDDVRSKVLYDHAYGLAIMSFWQWLRTDLTILWKTIAVVVFGRGR